MKAKQKDHENDFVIDEPVELPNGIIAMRDPLDSDIQCLPLPLGIKWTNRETRKSFKLIAKWEEMK